MLINFVSNLPKDLRSGGFSAMNVAALEALESEFAVHYAGPVDLAWPFGPKLVSKALRLAGLPGDYFFYSRAQLARFARDVATRCDPAAGLDFFHGFTPWTGLRPERPYIAWSDCTFRDYVRFYNQPDEFRAADLARIEQGEAAWLRGARAVGFTSRWAADRAIADYGLDPARATVLGIFGEGELPETDTYHGGHQFAFISTNFVAKGGPVALEAFRLVRARHAHASLVIVGDVPKDLSPEQNVEIVGFLRKEDANEKQRLREIFAKSRALIHPTSSDTAPVLLVEAGQFGCPAISARKFAIGEIVEHGVNGLLLENTSDISEIASKMLSMLEVDPHDYLAMRRAAWARARDNFAKQRFEARLITMVRSVLQVPS